MRILALFMYALYVTTQPTRQAIVDSYNSLINSTIDDRATKRSYDEITKNVTYIRASTPARILECVREFSILRCTKLFVLHKMEGRKMYPHSGNLTKDFLDQFFSDNDAAMDSLIEGDLAHISDAELTQRVIWNFKRFFKNRNIQLHFLPGIMVKIVPSKENKLKLSLKKGNRRHLQDIAVGRGKGDGGIGGEVGGGHGGGKKKNKKKKQQSYKDLMIQMAVPVMVMPAVLLGTFLPFVLPALKMATIMSTIMNNSAFLAALLYAARTHVMNTDNEPQQVSYSHGGYH